MEEDAAHERVRWWYVTHSGDPWLKEEEDIKSSSEYNCQMIDFSLL